MFGTHSRIGLVGPGNMGGGIARNLLRQGHRLQVFGRRPEVVGSLVGAGATPASSLAELGRTSDLVILALPDEAVVDEVLFGEGGVAHSLARGSCVIDTSTIAAPAARAIGARLQALGIDFLDAPISGGQAGAEAGTLGCMVGGEARVVDACRPVLAAFCRTITHVGAQGAGQAVKACNQVAVSAAMLGVAEALALARAQGVDPAVMREVLLGATGRSLVLEKHGARVIAGDFTPGFRAQLMRKDLRLALRAASEGGAQLQGAQLVERMLDELCEDGGADLDWCAVAMRVRGRAAGD